MGTLIKRNLEQHEEIIEASLKSGFDIGESLLDIQERKLYKEQFDTFEQYCKQRWNVSKTSAYQFMEMVIVRRDLSAIAHSEMKKLPGETINTAQARALSECADDAKTRAAILSAAVASAPKDKAGDPRVTAAVIKKAAAAVTKKRTPSKAAASNGAANGHADAPLPIPEREPGLDETEPKHDPRRPTDKSGNALPERPELLKAFSSRDLFISSEKARNVIYNNSLEIAKLIPDGEALKVAVDKHMKALFHMLQSFEPAYACKSCNGGKCAKCQKRGYTCSK